MKNITFLSTLLATTILAGNALAECGPNQLQAGWDCIDITGSCGDNCAYNIDGDTLYIDGPTDETTGSIRSGVFYHTGAEYSKVPSEVKNIVVRGNITDISSSAFTDAINVEHITLSDSITSIGYDAFAGMSSVTELIIPDSVRNIDGRAFTDMSSVTELIIPNSVTSIGGFAFAGMSSVTELIIPDSVTSIGSSAFSRMHSLTSITIPDVTTFGTNFAGTSLAFENLSSDIQIYCPEEVCARLAANRKAFGLVESQTLNAYTKDENGVYDVAGTLYSSAADMQTGVLSASCGDMATCLASIGTHCSSVQECQTLLDMSSEGTNCNSVSSCKTYLAEHPSAGNKTDSALIEKYNGTPLLYGKKIYTVKEAQEALGDGTKFHVGLTYK